jgi:hypothetical protein
LVHRLSFRVLSTDQAAGSFRLDGRLDKDFILTSKKDDKGNTKEYILNVYLQVLNILNSRNIMGVYAATGNLMMTDTLLQPNSGSDQFAT